MSTPALAQPASAPRLAAVVFTDVAGYSTRMQRDEPGTIALVRADFEKMRAACLRHGGDVVNTMGDGMLVCFASAANAVTFALEVQADFAARKAAAQGDPLEHRIGIHLGDVLATDDAGLQGDGINIASRLEAKAPAGGICMSGAVYDLVKNKMRMNARYAGSATLKNIAHPVPIWIVTPGEGAVRSSSRRRRWIAGVVVAACVASFVVVQWAWRGERKAPMPQGAAQVLAVLPFADMRDAASADHFADGLQEEILDALAGAGTWQLVSRTSASRFVGAMSIRQVASELGATHVIEGSVRRQGNEWRLTAQLIDVATDTHLFSHTSNLSTQFPAEEVQREFATEIVARARFMLSAGAWAYPANDPDMPERARLLYRQGAMEMRYGTAFFRAIPDVRRKIQEAHTLAPSNGRIVAMLAMADIHEAGFGMPGDKVAAIEAELREAERLSPGLAETRLGKAWLALFTQRPPPQILQAFDDGAAQLKDNFEWRLGRAFTLRWNGKVEQALAEFQSAAALDPYHGLPEVNIALLDLRLRQLDQAIDYLAAAGRRWPLARNTPTRLIIMKLYKDGDVAQARRSLEEWRLQRGVDEDDPLLRSLRIQLAWLDGRAGEVEGLLTRYPTDCLEDGGFPTALARIACKAPMRLAALAIQGRSREVRALAEPTQLAAEHALAESKTTLDRDARSITLAQVHVFTGDAERALASLADLQKQSMIRERETPENNQYLVDIAIGWLWAGERDKALEVLAFALTAKAGTFATIVARDPIFCPLYDDDRFVTLLRRQGEELVRHPGACAATAKASPRTPARR